MLATTFQPLFLVPPSLMLAQEATSTVVQRGAGRSRQREVFTRRLFEVKRWVGGGWP